MSLLSSYLKLRGGGSATVGGGGGNASVGVLLRQTGENDKGLFLTARGADLTWHGRGESVGDADPAIGGHVDLPNNGGGPGVNRHAFLRLQFPADITDYAGAASNNIVVRLNRLDAVAASPVVVWTAGTGTLTITVGATTSFSTLATAIAAFTTFTITTSQSDNAVGTDVFALGNNATGVNYSVRGGRDAIQPGIELLAQPEDAVNGPNILAKYDPDNHTLQQILDELEENDQGVTITVPYGTDLTAAPEAVPWMRGFDAGIGPTEAPTTGTGGLTQSQVDSRVRALAKGYALRGGPIVPDSEIPDQEARDAEVPTLLEAALTERTPSSAYTDQIPFLTASDEWSKADSQSWRQALSIDVGPWADTPGFFVFREGDYTTSNGQLYRVNTQTTKDLSDGPETNADFTLVGLFAGDWTDHWFKTGSIVRHSSALWQAAANISQGDNAPGSNANWHRISEDPATVVEVEQKSGSPLTFTLTRADGATYDVTVDGASDSVTGFNISGATFRADKRDGSHEQHTLPSGGTEVVPNPAGSDGDILRRIDIGGTNYVIDTEIAVGSGKLAGRRTTTYQRLPADLPDHTNPIEVPIPQRFTDGWAAMSASRDWPVVPISAISEDGGFMSGLDATENSITIAEGLYDFSALAENIWVHDQATGNRLWTGSNTDLDIAPSVNRAASAQRVALELVAERYVPNATKAMAQITFQPDGDRQSYFYVTIEGGADGPAGNEWTFKTQYDASPTASANSYTVFADTTEKEIILSIRGSVVTSRFDDIVADLNGELNLADGSASGITVSCISSGRTSTTGQPDQTATWASSDTAIENAFTGGGDWERLAESNSPYTRSSSFARQVTVSRGSTSSQSPGSDDANDGTGSPDYDGRSSHVSARILGLMAVPPGGATIRFRMTRGSPMNTGEGQGVTHFEQTTQGGASVVQEYDILGFPKGLSGSRGQGTTPWGYFCDVPEIQIFPFGRPVQTAPITPTPHITSFDHLSGDLDPVAGSIGDTVYGYSYTIAQGSHVGSARIIGFKGSTKPSGTATVLATLTDTDRGAGSVNIPADVTLADGEQYRIRLQIFAEGVTVGPDTQELGYQDIVIRAHAVATANYHWGRVARVENQDAETYAAAIVFADSDLETGTTLDTSGGYDATPDTTGNWIFYLAANADETQVSGWQSGGFPANAAFQDAVDQDYDSVSYKVYIMADAFYRTNADGTVNYVPVAAT